VPPVLISALPVAVLAGGALSPAAQALQSANNGFVLLCAALVLMMTPALALFYAGFVRSRNVLNTMVMSFAAMALVSVLWVLFGYSLAFSEGSGPLAPFIGGFQWAGLSNWSASYGDGQLSHGAVALFQLTFAIITPALISGAVVERMHFRAWIAFVVLWSTFVYLPLAHMVWGPGGFLGVDGLGALDFAGGLVVEMATGAVAGLVAITPAAGFVSPLGSVLIGFVAAAICSYALQLKNRSGLDDSLDVLPVHGVAGFVGIVLTGILALKVVNPAGANGLLAGNPGLLVIQLKAAGFTALWVGVGTYAVLKLIGSVMPLRVNDLEERQGLDIQAHGEEAYNTEFTG
jgi:ammonia channel protein AmtB